MSEHRRDVGFTWLSGWGPQNTAGIGERLRGTDHEAAPRSGAGHVLVGVPEGMSDEAARATLERALTLWTDTGMAPQDALDALGQGAKTRGHLPFDDVSHAAQAAGVQAASRRDGVRRTPEEVEQTRTLLERGLGAGARLMWEERDARAQAEGHAAGEGEAARAEARTRDEYLAALEREQRTEPPVRARARRAHRGPTSASSRPGRRSSRWGRHGSCAKSAPCSRSAPKRDAKARPGAGPSAPGPKPSTQAGPKPSGSPKPPSRWPGAGAAASASRRAARTAGARAARVARRGATTRRQRGWAGTRCA